MRRPVFLMSVPRSGSTLLGFRLVVRPAALAAPLPLSTSVVSAPAADKWRRNAADIERVLPLTAGADALARSVVARSAGQLGR